MAGCSVEDFSSRAGAPIHDPSLAAARVEAAEAAHRGPTRLVLTAMAENYLRRPDLADTIDRLQPYQQAGADVLYGPGLTRRPSNRPLLTSLGAEPVVADALERDALLAAVDGLTADAVIHELTALKRPPVRRGGMAQTNAPAHSRHGPSPGAARTLGAHCFVTQSMVLGCGYGGWGDEPCSAPAGPRHRCEVVDVVTLNESRRAGSAATAKVAALGSPSVIDDAF